jgi:hypothetical protein
VTDDMLAAKWYEVGNFYAQASAVVVALIIGILTIRGRRRRLAYSYRRVRSLNGLVVGGVVTPSGTVGPITDPYLIEIVLACRSTNGISISEYNGSDPIKFDVGVLIWSVGVKTYPAAQPDPIQSFTGNELHVGPSNMADGQIMTFAIAVDGKPPRKVRPTSPFHTLRLSRSAFRIAGDPMARLGWTVLGFIMTSALPAALGVTLAIITKQHITIPMGVVFAGAGLMSGAIYAFARR